MYVYMRLRGGGRVCGRFELLTTLLTAGAVMQTAVTAPTGKSINHDCPLHGYCMDCMDGCNAAADLSVHGSPQKTPCMCTPVETCRLC